VVTAEAHKFLRNVLKTTVAYASAFSAHTLMEWHLTCKIKFLRFTKASLDTFGKPVSNPDKNNKISINWPQIRTTRI